MLAIYESRIEWNQELGRRPRLLFIAHRAELLRQAAQTYRRRLREAGEIARVGWFAGESSELGADLVFASVAKLARPENLARLVTETFDYVVLDEVHHAAAQSYRRILDRLDPGFLLGLTATPDRADAADILGLFDDFIAYRADIARGIELDRPAGCSVDLELEAKLLLARLFHVNGVDEVERVYRELCLERGKDELPSSRPTAGELHRMGYLPGRLRDRHGSWFELVRAESGLAADELTLLDVAAGFLRELEVTPMTLCFKMVTLEVLLEREALLDGLPVDELAMRAHAYLRRSPELFADVIEHLRVQLLDDVLRARWIAYWKQNPIAAWVGARPRAWFRIDDDQRLRLDLDIALDLAAPLHRLTRELVDYRLAQYRDRRRRDQPTDSGFVCKILSNQRDPIVKLPRRDRARIPEGETDVHLPDGAVWQFRFAKELCNVARPAGTSRNQLPDLLRRWFGPRAGRPGTAFQIRFHAAPGGLWVEPVQADIIELASRRKLVAYPDLRAAAGHVASDVEPPGAELVSLPVDDADPDLFAVRVSGTSMDGGKQPLGDGDWAVMRLARSLPASAVEGRIVLVQVEGDAHGAGYQIKRLRRDGRGWQLVSDNPAGPTFTATDAMVPIARLERVIRPEDLAPPRGTVLDDTELAEKFCLDVLPPRSDRHAGHLFIFIAEPDLLVEPDRVRFTGVRPRPAETAFVLAKRDDTHWQYLGVARQTENRGVWSLPAVDLATWRAWGKGRQVSRRLPDGALVAARKLVDDLLARPDAERWIQHGDRRARIAGRARDGGLRIDGGPDGFAERTVSLTDLAWVIQAASDVANAGGLLDEARVNKLRYLDGTPKESTRWIDTAWAILAWHAFDRGRAH